MEEDKWEVECLLSTIRGLYPSLLIKRLSVPEAGFKLQLNINMGWKPTVGFLFFKLPLLSVEGPLDRPYERFDVDIRNPGSMRQLETIFSLLSTKVVSRRRNDAQY